MRKLIPVFLLLAVACSLESKIDKTQFEQLHRASIDMRDFNMDDFSNGPSLDFQRALRQLKAEHNAGGHTSTRAARALWFEYLGAISNFEIAILELKQSQIGEFNGDEYDTALRRWRAGVIRLEQADNWYSQGRIPISLLDQMDKDTASLNARR